MLVFCTYFPASVSAEPVTVPGSGFIVVASAPAADFYTTIQVGAAPFRVSFLIDQKATLPLSYLWDFGDGITSREQNPTHIYTRNGEFTVTLTVTNSFGQDTMTKTGYIAVGNPPEPDFTASPLQGKVPLFVTFTGVTNGSVAYWEWDFGDGSLASGQNPAHTYPKPGLYTVTATATNEFGTGQIVKSGIINTGVVPEAEFIAETRQGYPPLTVRFRDFSRGNPLAWSWDFGDGSTSTEKDPVHIYSQEGSYTTTLQVANAFGR